MTERDFDAVQVADHLKLIFRHGAARLTSFRHPSPVGTLAMRFTKPAWVTHRGRLLHFTRRFQAYASVAEQGTKSEQNPKPLSIFSVHVHPDGSRIATGGLDAKVRIWSTKPILSESAELSGRPPKSLSTLSMHTGPVLAVRWAFSGRWLASGSDDTIVMIWDLDP